MLQQAIANMLETNDKVENLNKEEEPNENFRTEKTIPKINSMDGLHSRIEGTEERICEHKDRKIEVTQSEQRKK